MSKRRFTISQAAREMQRRSAWVRWRRIPKAARSQRMRELALHRWRSGDMPTTSTTSPSLEKLYP